MPYDDENDGDEVGTILRPLHRPQQGYIAEWERDPKNKPKSTWDPTIRWGDRVEIALGAQTEFTQDLLRVTLEKPATCQVQFHADVINPASPSTVSFVQVELVIGNGSQMTRVRKRFNSLPQAVPGIAPSSVPLDATWTLPMTNIRGRVSGQGSGAVLECALWLCPFSREQ